MNEKNIINGLLILCIVLGFTSFALGILPRDATVDAEPPSTNIRDIVDFSVTADIPAVSQEDQTFVVQFTPEPAQRSPFLAEAAKIIEPEEQSVDVEPMLTTRLRERRFRASRLSETRPTSYATTREKKPDWLMIPAGLEGEVDFWKKIYSHYDSHNVVMHDAEHLDIIFRVVDVSEITTNSNLTDDEKRVKLEEHIEEVRKEIAATLKQLATISSPRELTDQEWAIWRLYRDGGDPKRFLEAADRIRGQQGLKDKFFLALQYSGRLLGEIEGVFETQGLPPELTRLIFVESMFNPAAHSAAGARGIWQFMRPSAIHYDLKLNRLVDERLDPIASSRAAARLLRENFEMLGTWPLAINAYNAGRGRMKQAVTTLGTSDIARIIREFQHPHYGFASRNFYPEFLAAADVVSSSREIFGKIDYDAPLTFEEVTLHGSISLPDVISFAGISLDEVKDLNPALTPSVFTGNVLLPEGFRLNLPEGHGKRFLAAIGHQNRSRQ